MSPPTMRIVFLDRNTFHPDIEFPFDRLPGAEWTAYAGTPPQELAMRAAGAEILVSNKVRLSGAELSKLPRLRLIAVAATGVDHIDLAAAARSGIAVANARGYAGRSVPEHVFALLLALRRNLARYRAAARDGTWSRSAAFCLHAWPIDDLAGSTLGIVGAGTLGREVAQRAVAFGMRVLLAERRGAGTLRAGRVPFEQVLAEADAVTLHVPWTVDTHHLVGAAELARMKPTALLVNTARGGVVDEDALLAALRGGTLGGAAVDVLGSEPPAPDHPLLMADLPNLIVTPHVAWASRQAQQALALEVVENIAAFARGERRNRIV
jgi:glycerate dehydrogenase